MVFLLLYIQPGLRKIQLMLFLLYAGVSIKFEKVSCFVRTTVHTVFFVVNDQKFLLIIIVISEINWFSQKIQKTENKVRPDDQSHKFDINGSHVLCIYLFRVVCLLTDTCLMLALVFK